MTRSTDSQSTTLPIPNLLRDLLAVALLCVLVIAFFWKIALAGRVLASGDVFIYFYPYWAEATRAIQAGRLPLWNPYLFMGAPFLANSQVGVLYPLNWLLWLLLPAHQSVHLTIVLHLCLAALNGYLWGRTSLRLRRVGAWTVGAIFALGGYLGAQVEHVNQLQGLAWLPLALTLCDMTLAKVECESSKKPLRLLGSPQLPGSSVTFARVWGAKPKVAFAGLALVVGLVFLAGHTQTAFISLVGLAAYGLGPALWRGLRWREWRPLVHRAMLLAAAVGLGLALAAAQLIPTWELSRLSVRAGGLPFNERVSFSLSPFYLARTLLPVFAEPVPPEHIEHVAYVGVVGLALAAVAILNSRSSIFHPPSSIFHPRSSNPNLQPPVFLLALGLFFSLGLYNPIYLLLARFVPGFAHFRVPARWLVLYALGMAAQAGWGADILLYSRGRVDRRTLLPLAVVLVALAGWAVIGVRIGDGGQVGWATVVGWGLGTVLMLALLLATTHAPRLATVGLLALSVVELFAASFALPYSRATAPQAFTSLRPSIAHLLAAPLSRPSQGEGLGDPHSRFLSMSDITFDPGDLPEIEVIYGPQLSTGALYDYVIAAKHKEVLSPNLPLAFGVPAVDGYDGGVLPLAHYVTLQALFLSEHEGAIDGRLRENLRAIPDGRWLSLFNVQHVITDKLHDAWLDDVFYDLQFGAQLGHGDTAAVAHVPRFKATSLGVVSCLRGGAALSDGSLVGVVEVGFGEGLTRTFELRAGQHTVEGSDYVARLQWEEPAVPSTVVVRAALPEGELAVRGLSLIDERTGGFQALVLSDRGRFRLAHSGDVKIYENLDVLPRTFLVHGAVLVAEDERALALMRDELFDPAVEIVLSPNEWLVLGVKPWRRSHSLPGWELARVTHYAPERVEIDVEAEAPGYLVLTDAWYPGWEATVDGESVPIHRADLFFRAVAVDSGSHHVVFTFRPASLRIGAGVSLAGLFSLLVVIATTALRCPKRGAML